MKILIFFIIFTLIIINSCTIQDTTDNIFSIDSLVIYNYDFNAELSAIKIDNDSLYLTNPDNNDCDLIIASYVSNSIVFLSPSKDTIRFSNPTITGIYDVGTYPYTYYPDEGYYDMEFLVNEHYYFIQFSNGKYARLYLINYNADSLICDIELLLEGDNFNQ